MAIVAVEEFRTQVQTDGELLRLTLPRSGWTRVPLAVFLTFWLGAWSVGGVFAMRELIRLLTHRAHGPTLFMAVWLCGWVVGESMGAVILGWLVAGRETLTLSPDALEVRQAIGGLGRTRVYDIGSIRRLRAREAAPFGRNGMPSGALAFDYGARTVRFGLQLNEAEANHVRDLLAQRDPRLAG